MQNIKKIRDTSGQDKVMKGKGGIWNTKWVGSLLVMLVAFGLITLSNKFGQLFSADQSVSEEQIQLARVEKGLLKRDIAVQGKVVAAVSPTLFASSTGTVSLNFNAGDKVSRDELLATIDSPELESRYAQQKNQLEELALEYQKQKIQIKAALLDNQQAIELASVDLNLARKNQERAKLNIKVKVISQVEYEQQQAELKKIELQHRHAVQKGELQKEKLEFELKTREFQLERQKFVVADLKRQVGELEIRAPISGVIGNLMVKEKDTVNQNSALLTLVDLSAFEIEISIPESYADDLGVGLQAEFSLDGGDYLGQLAAISPEVNNGQVTGRIRFQDKAPKFLRQNQRVSTRILIESKSDVLKVRRGSFVETGGGRVAYVRSGEFVVKRDIQLGITSVSEVEILSGLSAGEEIVVSSIEQFIGSQKIYLSN